MQREGGPCAVIAPVQAFLLKILLMETPGHSYNDVGVIYNNEPEKNNLQFITNANFIECEDVH